MNENDIDRIQDPRDSDFRSIDDRNRLSPNLVCLTRRSTRLVATREQAEFEREWNAAE